MLAFDAKVLGMLGCWVGYEARMEVAESNVCGLAHMFLCDDRPPRRRKWLCRAVQRAQETLSNALLLHIKGFLTVTVAARSTSPNPNRSKGQQSERRLESAR